MSLPAAFYADDLVSLWHGDCLGVVAEMPDASVDAVVTDPPYGLEFMGKEWDSFAPERTKYHGERADTSKGVGSDDTRPSSRHHITYSMQRPTFRRCAECGKREFSGTPCRCPSPVWLYEQPDGTPTRMAAYQRWCEAWARECLRVLKPGGHLLAFGGTRTYHRLACAIEDAGFEIRDSLHWIYGSGFPKSLDVSKAIDKAAGAEREVVGDKLHLPGYHLHGHDSGTGAFGAGLSSSTAESRLASAIVTAPATPDAARWSGYGTALKPAHEPIVLARKPLAGTVAQNVLEHGTGALNIDGCRVGSDQLSAHGGGVNASGRTYGAGTGIPALAAGSNPHVGRWPPNILLSEDAAEEMDRQSGVTASKPGVRRNQYNAVATFGSGNARDREVTHDDAGGASRFFPVFRYQAKAASKERPRLEDGTAHPTVKPLALMTWLITLVAPPGALILDPFAGSGTTLQAARGLGVRCYGIEQDERYCRLAAQRLSQQVLA